MKMDSISHLLLNLVLGSLYLKLTNQPVVSWSLLVIVLIGVFIDVDHLLLPVLDGRLRSFRTKELLRFALSWLLGENRRDYDIYLFHTYEFLILIFYLSLNNSFLFFVFLGLVFHFVGDALANTLLHKNLSWVWDYSLILWFYKLSKGSSSF